MSSNHSHTHHQPHEHHNHGHHSHSHAHHDRNHFYNAALDQIREITSSGQDVGPLAEIAAYLSGAQGSHHPNTCPGAAILFLADHGVAKSFGSSQEGSSFWLQPGFDSKIPSILARKNQINLFVMDVGTFDSSPTVSGTIQNRIENGTKDFTQESALSITQVKQAMKMGANYISQYLRQGVHTFVLGAGGSGSRISAAAIAAYILNQPGYEVVGSSDSLSPLAEQLINSALKLHRSAINNPVTLLAHLGGFEMAALVGAITTAASHDSVLLVDGFTGLVSAAVAVQLSDRVQPSLFIPYTTSLPGHALLVEHLHLQPLLNIKMMCDDLTGAMLALPLLDAAAELLGHPG